MPATPRSDHESTAAALHAETRRLLALAVTMPRRTARIDDALDRWLLHPVTLTAAVLLCANHRTPWIVQVVMLAHAIGLRQQGFSKGVRIAHAYAAVAEGP